MTPAEAEPFDAEVDPVAASTLREQGLDLRAVAEPEDVLNWFQATRRGFLDGESRETEPPARLLYRRKIGVYDAAGRLPELPIATFATWDHELSVPAARVVPAVAISSVTVAPTHRRRGLLRTMMTGALHAIHRRGFAFATLTATEASIYGRFGFGQAASIAEWKIDTRRARWIGPTPGGRLDFISREEFRRIAPALHDRIRLHQPGEVRVPTAHWGNWAQLNPDDEKPGTIRVVQYRDEAGDVQGIATYSVGGHASYEPQSVEVGLLLTATDDAYAALWRFLLELDLIGDVTIGQRAVDEPLWWMLADQRAATITVNDHHYLRILDVPDALEARTYASSGAVVLEVSDDLGFAAGRFRLDVDANGAGSVTRDPAPDASTPLVELGITELGSLFLGGVSARTLAAAGRIRVDDADAVDDILRSRVTPRLGFWY